MPTLLEARAKEWEAQWFREGHERGVAEGRAELLRGPLVRKFGRSEGDPETLEPVPIERIVETPHRHLSDLVWRVRLRGGGGKDWAYLFVLIEFQSAVDHLMALRVSTCVNLLYRGLWQAGTSAPRTVCRRCFPWCSTTVRRRGRRRRALRSWLRRRAAPWGLRDRCRSMRARLA